MVEIGEPALEVERVDEVGGVRQGRVEDSRLRLEPGGKLEALFLGFLPILNVAKHEDHAGRLAPIVLDGGGHWPRLAASSHPCAISTI